MMLGSSKHVYSQLNYSCYSYPSEPRLQYFRLHIYGISKWLLTQLTHTHTATTCVSPHMHSMCTSYVLYTYLYGVYVPVGGAVSIRDPYICAIHESVPTNYTLSPQSRCLCSENVAVGFKTSIEAYFVEKNSTRMPELLEVSKLRHNF